MTNDEPLTWIDQQCRIYKEQWKQQLNPRIEDFLAAAAPEHTALLFVDILDLEIHLRRQAGEHPDISEYEQRFTEFRDEIQACFRTNRDEVAGRNAADPGPITMPVLPSHRYKFIKLLGVGGFGEVWLARDPQLERNVAIKTLSKTKQLDVDVRDAIIHEGKTLAAHCTNISHIVTVFDWIEESGMPYLVMDYIPGPSLWSKVRKNGPLDWFMATHYVCDVLEGLTKLHDQRIVHRDVTPANLLLDNRTDEVCLIDFGLASMDAIAEKAAGTLAFMAPESLHREVSPKVDVYGIASTLFFLMAGEPSFAVNSDSELPGAVRSGLPNEDERFGASPEAVEELIREGLRFSPDERPTLAEFSNRLRGALNQNSVPAVARAPVEAETPRQIDITVLQVNDRTNPIELIATTPNWKRKRGLRDITPKPAPRIMLRNKDTIQLKLQVRDDGCLLIFNIGPTGNLDVLYPLTETRIAMARVAGNQTIVSDELDVQPPSGKERIVAIWSFDPLPLDLSSLQSLVDDDGTSDGPSRSYRASRDIRRLRNTLADIHEGAFWTCQIELDHI